MLNWIGLRSRDSFNGKSAYEIEWQQKIEKYRLRREDWSVYRSLLFFYMSNRDSFLPELMQVILRFSFIVSIHERIDEARQFGWRKIECYDSKVNHEYVRNKVTVLQRRHRENDDKVYIRSCADIWVDKCHSFEIEEGFYISDPFLNDNWMKYSSSSIYDDEMYNIYLFGIIRDLIHFLLPTSIWLIDFILGFRPSILLSEYIAYIIWHVPIHSGYGLDQYTRLFVIQLLLNPIRLLFMVYPFFVETIQAQANLIDCFIQAHFLILDFILRGIMRPFILIIIG